MQDRSGRRSPKGAMDHRGGDTCQQSIKNGIDHLKGKMAENDIVLIHMSSYSPASAENISDSIRSTKEKGNAFEFGRITRDALF